MHQLASPLSGSAHHHASHERSSAAGFGHGNASDLVTHAPFLDHALGNVGNLLNVVGSTGGDHVLTVNDFFRETASEGDSQLGLEVLTTVHARLKTRLLRSKEGKSAGTVGSGDDGDLLDLIVVRNKGTDNGVTGLVVGNKFLLLGNLVASLLLQTNHDYGRQHRQSLPIQWWTLPCGQPKWQPRS